MGRGKHREGGREINAIREMRGRKQTGPRQKSVIIAPALKHAKVWAREEKEKKKKVVDVITIRRPKSH